MTFDDKLFQKSLDFLKKEFAGLQTGRANSALVEEFEIEAWGNKQPLKHIANISVPDSSSIVIEPWDKNILNDIERQFQKNTNLNFSIKNDGVILRLNIPPLTEERRKELAKIVHSMSEKAKISIRNERHELHAELKKEKENSDISEDDFFRQEKELQEKVDQANKKIDEMMKKKEGEVMKV